MKIDLGEDFTFNMNINEENISLSERLLRVAFYDLTRQIDSLTRDNQDLRMQLAMIDVNKSTNDYLQSRTSSLN